MQSVIYRLWAHLSPESEESLDVWFRESPTLLRSAPVEIFASYDPIEAQVDADIFFVAFASALKIGWDPDRGTSPAVVLFDSTDFRVFYELSSESHRPATPANFLPVMVLSEDVTRRRNYVTYINSLSDSWNRNPLQLRFTSWTVTSDTLGVRSQVDTSLTHTPTGLML